MAKVEKETTKKEGAPIDTPSNIKDIVGMIILLHSGSSVDHHLELLRRQ